MASWRDRGFAFAFSIGLRCGVLDPKSLAFFQWSPGMLTFFLESKTRRGHFGDGLGKDAPEGYRKNTQLVSSLWLVPFGWVLSLLYVQWCCKFTSLSRLRSYRIVRVTPVWNGFVTLTIHPIAGLPLQ